MFIFWRKCDKNSCATNIFPLLIYFIELGGKKKVIISGPKLVWIINSSSWLRLRGPREKSHSSWNSKIVHFSAKVPTRSSWQKLVLEAPGLRFLIWSSCPQKDRGSVSECNGWSGSSLAPPREKGSFKFLSTIGVKNAKIAILPWNTSQSPQGWSSSLWSSSPSRTRIKHPDPLVSLQSHDPNHRKSLSLSSRLK